MKLALTLLICCLGSPSTAARSWSLCEVEGLRADIVVDGDAGAALRWVAQDLQSVLEKVTGRQLPVVTQPSSRVATHLFVGPQAALRTAGLPPLRKDLGEDGYVIRSVADGIALCGVRGVGTAYAVSDFLEREVGCRWYLPHPLGTVIPRKPALSVTVTDRSERPAIRFRSLGGLGEWARRRRLSESVPLAGSTHSKVWGTAHTFFKLLPPETYFADHPDWFAEIGGQRRGPSQRPSHGPQLCTSNPGAAKATLEAVRKLFDEDPNLEAVHVGPNDGLLFCECAQCQALDEPGREWRGAAQRGAWRGVLSRRLMLFYNQLARGLRQSHPDKLLKVMVYSWYQEPPSDKHLRFEDNVLVMLTHSGNPSPYESVFPSCYNHAVADPACRPNRERFLPALRGWAERCKHLGLYEYYDKASMCGTLFPLIHTIRRDIPFYQRTGVEYFYSQAGLREAGNIGLNYYVAAQLMWNPQANVDALLDDFYRNFYGPAAAPMKTYYELLDRTWADSGADILGWPVAAAHFLTDDIVARLRRLLEEASQLAETDKLVRRRVELQRLSLTYTDMVIQLIRTAESSIRQASGEAYWDLPEQAQQVRAAPAVTEKIAAIQEYRREHASSNCLGSDNNNYTKRLLSPDGWRVLRDFVPARDPLQRPQWARENKAPPPPPRGDSFEVWVYGYDFDASAETAEHRLLIRDAADRWRDLSPLPPQNQAGNRRTRTCILGPFPWAGLPTESVVVQLADAPDTEWTGSSVYAVYLMPPGLARELKPDLALKAEAGRNRLRRRSFGFLELPRRGATFGDAGPWKGVLELSGRPGQRLPQGIHARSSRIPDTPIRRQASPRAPRGGAVPGTPVQRLVALDARTGARRLRYEVESKTVPLF